MPRTKEQDRKYQTDYAARKSADPLWAADRVARRKKYNATRYAKRMASPELKAKHHDWIVKLRTNKPHEYKIYRIKNRYGVSDEVAEQLLQRKAIGCEACGSKTRPHIDHNHRTGKVRGILCHTCNVALGQVDDSADRLEKLIDYLLTRS